MHKAGFVNIIGNPNVGKSTLINQISGRKGAKAENRPGVTRGKQWVTVDSGLLLLDTPGILWPKFDDPNVGMMLAYTGAVKEGILDIEELSSFLMELLWKRYPQAVKDRYGIDAEPDTPGYELLQLAGKKRGFLMRGNEINTERMAKVQKATHATLALIFGNDTRLDSHSAKHNLLHILCRMKLRNNRGAEFKIYSTRQQKLHCFLQRRQFHPGKAGSFAVTVGTIFDVHSHIIYQFPLHQFLDHLRAGAVGIQFDQIPQCLNLLQKIR